jgi:hypothetical protein
MSDLASPLERLDAVCPRCRRLVAPGVPCAIDGAEVLDLGDASQRARMVDATWGTAAQRATLKRTADQGFRAKRFASGAVVGGFTLGVAFAAAASPPIAFFAATMGAIIGGATARGGKLMMIPSGGIEMPKWPRVGSGRVVGGESIVSPASDAPCLAWSLELRYQGSSGTRTTLRAGATRGFEVVLDGGDRVRVPAGPIWLDGPFAQLDGEDATVDDLIAWLDPDADADSDWKLFPFNIIAEQVLYANDRVDVLGVVEPRPINDDAARLYRDSPRTELVHPSLPVLRRAQR